MQPLHMFIDAADKYSIVNLKLEEEAAFVDSTSINLDNTMNNLLYAYASVSMTMNCALLKLKSKRDSREFLGR